MRLDECVAGVGIGFQSFLRGVIGTDEKRTAHRVGRKEVPEPLDAVVGDRGVVEIGMGEVKTDVFDTHHDAFSREGLGQTIAQVYPRCSQDQGGGVHQDRIAPPGLDSRDRLAE